MNKTRFQFPNFRSSQTLTSRSLAFAMLLLFATATPASAGIGDKLKSKANTLKAKVTQGTSSVREKAQDKAEGVGDKLEDMRNRLEEIGTMVEEGVGHLDPRTFQKITEGAQQFRAMLDEQFEGYDEFRSQHAEEFRAQLVAFLRDLLTLRESIETLVSPCGPPSKPRGVLPKLIPLIERAPTSVLYPVWKGFQVDHCLIDYLRDGVDALQTIHEVLGGMDELVGLDLDVSEMFHNCDPTTIDSELFAARLSASRLYLEHYSELKTAIGRIKKLSFALSFLGTKLESMGENGKEITIGVHGYCLLTLDTDRCKSIGKNMKSISKDGLDKLVKFVQTKLNEAKTVSAMNLVITKQEAILQTQKAILRNQQAMLGQD